jgi:hypothetical protein
MVIDSCFAVANMREEEGPGGGHHGPRFFAFSGHPRGRATEGEFATNAAGGWGEGHAKARKRTYCSVLYE